LGQGCPAGLLIAKSAEAKKAGATQHRYLGRYLPGQALYRRRADPEASAHILVDNERADAPRIERWTTPGVACHS